MGFLASDGFPGENDEMTSISGDQAPAFLRSMGELLAVGQLDAPDVVSTDGVDPALAEKAGDPWREVLVQVELHAVRTTLGSLAATASRVSAAFSSISASISCEYLL